jgi:hypothetical protein
MEFNVWPLLLFGPIARAYREDGKFNTEKKVTKYMTLVRCYDDDPAGLTHNILILL